MALSADRDGFLVGEKIHVDTASMERSLEIWRAIRADTREVLNILRGSGIRRGVAGSRSSGPQQAKTTAATPQRPGAAPRVPAKASEPTRAQVARPVNTKAATPVRDSKGRFIASEARSSAPSREAGATPRPRTGRESSISAADLKEIGGHIGDAITAGNGAIDPATAAVKETKDFLWPIAKATWAVGKFAHGFMQNRQERKKRRLDAEENAEATAKKQTPWFRRILRALGAGGAAGESGGGGGILSALLGGLLPRGAGIAGGGLIGGLLARITGGTGIFSRMLGGLKGVGVSGLAARLGPKLPGAAKGLGAAAVPLTAISSAMDSLKTSTEVYAQRYGTEAGQSVGKDILVRAAGIFQDFGNALTLGMADKFGNWVSRLFSGSDSAEKPSGGKNPFRSAPPVGPTGAPMSTAPAGAGSLLDLIGNKEGGKAGYDAFWNGSRVQPSKPMSQMTLGEVRQWQRDTLNEQARRGVKPSRRSSAAGRYQFMSGTLPAMMAKAGLTENDMFSPANQDKLALALLDNSPSRGLSAWKSGKATDAQFADYVASQWAAFKDSGGRGQYDAAGFNKATVGADAVIRAAQGMKATPSVPKAPAPVARPSIAPKVGQTKLPPPPSLPVQIGSAGKGPEPLEVIIPQHLGQNLSDRGIAQLATGGMGGSGLGQRMT